MVQTFLVKCRTFGIVLLSLVRSGLILLLKKELGNLGVVRLMPSIQRLLPFMPTRELQLLFVSLLLTPAVNIGVSLVLTDWGSILIHLINTDSAMYSAGADTYIPHTLEENPSTSSDVAKKEEGPSSTAKEFPLFCLAVSTLCLIVICYALGQRI